MPNIKIALTYDECRALDSIASEDLRTPEQMCRWLVRQEAARRGLSLSYPSKGGINSEATESQATAL